MLYSGFGISNLLFSRELEKYGIFLIPFSGLAATIIGLYTFGYIGVSVKVSLIFLFIFFTFLNILAYLGRNDRVKTNLSCITLVPILIAFFVLLIGRYPIVQAGNLMVIGVNGDAMTHCLVADYLENTGIIVPDVEAGRGDLDIVALVVSAQVTRWVSSFFRRV